jgi:serine/threonine-protein kinase
VGSVPAVRILGRYALHGAIASGGMATVHFGRLLGAVGFARTVAIKRLHPHFASDPDFVSMFVDEARLASRFRSPHVVPTLDVVTTEGELFLVMEYIPGESLARLMRLASESRERVPVAVAAGVMAGVLRGLDAAHEARSERGEPLGIVHRDVSPQNVIVGSDGLARVLDFGVAKASGRLQTTRDGQIKGKLGYMGPEQLRADTVTRATDVYAASVVLWELLAGERLFKADNEAAVVTRILQGVVVPPSRASSERLPARDPETQRLLEEGLDPIVMRGLDRDPTRRFQTTREMATALEQHVAPAGAAQIGEWVERLAGPALSERAAQMAAIERGDAGEAPAPNATAAMAATQPTQASSISVATPAARELGPLRAGRTLAVSAVLATVIIGLPVAAYLGARRSPGSGPAAAGGAPAAESSVSPAPPPPPTAGSAAPAPEVSSTSVARSSTETSGGRADAAAPSRHARTPRPSDCNPPFTWDVQGNKHYKANCL